MEHAELIMEMPHIEKLPTQERLTLARKRRKQQLNLWQQKDKEFARKTRQQQHQQPNKPNKRSIIFNNSVVLLEAAARNDIDEVRHLLMKGVNPDSCNEDGLTALHQCCIDNNESLLLLLLEHNANVNAEDSEKWTPLHAAATCGHLRLVRILIARGANLLAVNADGNMPYDICEDEAALDYIESEMANRGVTQTLIDDTRAATERQMLIDMRKLAAAGGNLEAYDSQGATPLHIAAANGYVSVVEFLLDHNVRTDVKDKDDWQPSHAAACWGHVEVLEMLAQAGANLNAKNKHDETPEDICEDPEIKERILELRTEQENKRQAEAAKKKVRRSQSNTRTQSVRRTSLRDKGLTARRDAVEEARFRIQAEKIGLETANDSQLVADVSSPTKTALKSSSPFDISSANNNNNNNNNEMNEMSNALQVIENRKAPDGKDDDSSSLIMENMMEATKENSYTTDVNGKVTVHVVVTINGNGTLADLKKQRMQIRNNSSDVSSNSLTSPINNSANNSPNGGDNNSIASVTDVIRFTGEMTEENVGYSKSKRCCVIQ